MSEKSVENQEKNTEEIKAEEVKVEKDILEDTIDEEKEETIEIKGETSLRNEEVEYLKKRKTHIVSIVIAIIICMFAIFFSVIFALINVNNNNIVSGVRIAGIDVSGLSKEEAISKLEMIYDEKKQNDILLKYKEYNTTISPEALEIKYDIEKAVNKAISIGKEKNIIVSNYKILNALIVKENIYINMTINEEILNQNIKQIQGDIPGAIEEPGYYIEEDKLIITKGKEGIAIKEDELTEKIKSSLYDITTKQEVIEIPITNKKPDKIDIEKIYKEVYKEVKDAYYTKEPFAIYPEVEGVNFDIEEARKILLEDKDTYEIQLIITKPQKTIAEIGSEAFPEVIGTCSTRYDASLTDRTTNLVIACQKIDGKIILPGEIFSYNQTLGERTRAAGYKEAKVFENGQVVDGLGGGICQISSTLYNAVLQANMEIVERRNHQFVTSYLPAGKDATVVYGLTDFKFKNTRTYAIRINANCLGGVATVSVSGIKEENEYNITLETRIISTIPYTVKYEDDNTLIQGQEQVIQKGANGLITETYIVKSQNGKIVSRDLLSKDTYSAMQRIIRRGTRVVPSNNNVQTKPTQATQPTEQTKPTTTVPVEENKPTDTIIPKNTTNTTNKQGNIIQ